MIKGRGKGGNIDAKFEITQEVIDRVYKLTANGISKTEVAGCLCITEKTLNTLIRKYPLLRKAIFDGRYAGLEFATGKLRALMEKGNPAAILFYLKTRWLWRDRERFGDSDTLPTDKKQDKIDFISMTPMEAARVYQQVMKGGK